QRGAPGHEELHRVPGEVRMGRTAVRLGTEVPVPSGVDEHRPALDVVRDEIGADGRAGRTDDQPGQVGQPIDRQLGVVGRASVPGWRATVRAVGWRYPPSDADVGSNRVPAPGRRILMKLVGLLDAALADEGLAAARDLAAQGVSPVDLTAPAALRPFVAAAVAGQRPVIAVTATSREAEDLAAALGSLLPAGPLAVYPAW